MNASEVLSSMAFFRVGPPCEPAARSGNEKPSIPVGRSQLLLLSTVSVGFSHITERINTPFLLSGDGYSTITGFRSCLFTRQLMDT